MFEFLISLSVIERTFLFIIVFITVMYALNILRKKNIVKGKEGFSLVDGEKKQEYKNVGIEPIWEKDIPNSQDRIGFYWLGNYTKIYGNRWNSTLDKKGYALIRETIDQHIYLNGKKVGYDFWIVDVIGANIQSSLISMLIDKSKLFKTLYIVTDSKNFGDLKSLTPEYSKIENIELILSE